MNPPIKPLLRCAVLALGFSATGSALASSILQFAGSTLMVPGFPSTATTLTDFRAADGSLHRLSIVDGSTGRFEGFPIGTNIEAVSFTAAAPVAGPLFSFAGYTFVLDEGSVTVQQGGSGPNQFLHAFGRGTIFGPAGFEDAATVSLHAVGVSHQGRISFQGNLGIVNVPEVGPSALLVTAVMACLALYRPGKNRC